jgi:Haem-binding domain/Cytochrome P460
MSFSRPTGLALRFGAGLALVFLMLQLVRPELASPPGSAELRTSPEVESILRTSCYACHSNETRLSWFDEIVPAYQLVVHDVKTARTHLNFSELGALPPARQRAILFEAVNQIQMGAMPLPRYTRLHPEAAITASQLTVLRNYLLPAKSVIPPADTTAADAQYQLWIASAAKVVAVAPSPNGIAFLPDYKNWKAISTTDRTDSNTLRVILGNDVAIQAIADNRINPWPDGTTFAKVAWRQQPDENGIQRSGVFLQVAFMIKDAAKYASTADWGWAEWVGTELKPYGESPKFASECVACHAPLRNNDYVFTMPIRSKAPR